MMDLDEAIQSLVDEMGKQAALGHIGHVENLSQMVEWLKELKAYREQGGQRMNESEKERLIKKDIASIENRVRHAFNQGYEMGLKESRSENPNTCGDAISRQAVMDYFRKWQPYMATRLWDFEQELSELPPVSSQQRTGRWMKEGQGGRYKWMCSNCGTHHRALYDYCPSCGTKMEVVGCTKNI